MTEWFDSKCELVSALCGETYTKGEVVATFVVLCGFLGLYVIGCAL